MELKDLSMNIQDLFQTEICPVCQSELYFSSPFAAWWCSSVGNINESHYTYSDKTVRISVAKYMLVFEKYASIFDAIQKNKDGNVIKTMPITLINDSKDLNDLFNNCFKYFKWEIFS